MVKKHQQEYNDYSPYINGHSSQPLPVNIKVRYATYEDASAVAQLAAQNNVDPNLDFGYFLDRTEKELCRGGNLNGFHIVVAEVNNEVIGYGRSIYYNEKVIQKYSFPSPVGWYLMGVTVSPKYRGQGVGHLLTKKRLEHIGKLSNRAYYIANEENITSIKLHESFGFRLLKKGPGFLKVKFNNDAGMLFECILNEMHE